MLHRLSEIIIYKYILIYSFSVGATTRDPALCEQLFSCRDSSASSLLDAALDVTPEPNMRQGRATCAAAGNLCPGVSIGCALCGIFLDSTCSAQCTIAALYCGVSGYACKAEADRAVLNLKEMVGDEERQKEFMEFMFGDLAEQLEPRRMRNN